VSSPRVSRSSPWGSSLGYSAKQDRNLALECVSFWVLPLATLGMGIEGFVGYEEKRMGKLVGL